MGIRRVGHAAIQVTDIERSAQFAQNVLGLRETERSGGVVYLSCSERHHDLVLIAGDRLALDHLAFEVEHADDLDAIASRCRAAGYPLLEHEPESGIRASIRIAGPAGFAFELFSGIVCDRSPTYPATGVRPLGLEHATLVVKDLDAMEQFFVHELGFIASDRVAGEILWLRSGPRHHNFNLIAGDSDTFHHQAWEVGGLESIGRVADQLAQEGKTLVWGPGRHGPGHVLFAYFRDSDGVVNEYCADVATVGDDYRAIEWPADPMTANQWGPVAPAGFHSLGIAPVGRAYQT